MKNANPPLISVVLPVYNVASYIKEALDSLLNQTVQDFEILVIDDCSTDETLAVVESIPDERIKIIYKEANKGLIDSLNIGFAAAKGKYIARMDGDDISPPLRFEKQLHVLEKHAEIKACGCWLEAFGKENKIIKHKEFHDEIVANLLLSCSMSLGSVMMDANWAKNFRFDEAKKHVEDYDFWSRAAWSGKLYNIQEVLYCYRTHNTQVSALYNQEQRKGDIAIKLFLFKKLQYNNLKFNDSFIEKMLLQKEYFSVEEFGLYLNWLKNLIKLNLKAKIYNPSEFLKIIDFYQKDIIFTIYFSSKLPEIDKKWRIRAVYKLSFKNFIFVLRFKAKEIFKTLLKK